MERSLAYLVRRSAGLVLIFTMTSLPACDPSASKPAPPFNRFHTETVITSDGPRVLRFDTATGSTWLAPVTGGRRWEGLGEEISDLPAEPRPARFELQIVRVASAPLTLIRTDTLSGEVWRLAIPTQPTWVAYREK